MATVNLRAPLRDLAGGSARLEFDGETVGELLRGLERAHPRIKGWILDDQGKIRTHVNVFVNGERIREDAPLASDDVVYVLPSISGGAST
jgi:molybdopterin converting factor small subunit